MKINKGQTEAEYLGTLNYSNCTRQITNLIVITHFLHISYFAIQHTIHSLISWILKDKDIRPGCQIYLKYVKDKDTRL